MEVRRTVVTVALALLVNARGLRLEHHLGSLTENSSLDRADHCANACQILATEYKNQVSLPGEQSYDEALSHFWSEQQAQTLPACIFRPASAQEVGTVVRLSSSTSCPFAAKSGGHAAFANASNIHAGVTIDFSALNDITLNTERGTVSVGPGNTWFDLYQRLEQDELTAIGGRIAGIGIGGLTLGGGISFFSNRRGWACDNVASYEVVTASGEIIIASSDTNDDLYWALRGGGNNFGLVTMFELFTYPLEKGLIWSRALVHPPFLNASLFEASIDFGINGVPSDPDSGLITSVFYDQKEDAFTCVTQLEHAHPQAEGTHPPVFHPFYNVGTPRQDTTATRSLLNVTLESNSSNPSGMRESYWVASFQMNAALIQDLLDIWIQELGPIKQSVAELLPVFTLQIIATTTIERMSTNGGNALGLQNEAGPLMLITPSAMWEDAAADEAVLAAYTNWLEQSTARAEELGLSHRFIYMNYASQFEDVIASYGEDNHARLKEISKKYDPDQVFQKLQPGHFKL